jgi:CHASE3 domain sensor protein
MLNRLKIGTKIGASFALGLAFFAAIAAISYQGIRQMVEQSERERHTFEVLDQVNQIDADFSKAESNLRGYLISGDAQYLDVYGTTVKSLNSEVRELRRLTADNPNQQRRLDSLEPLIADRIALMKQRITLWQQGGLTAVQAAAARSGNPGKQLTAEILDLTSEIKNEEQQLLLLRSGNANSAAQQALDSITYGVPIYCVLLSLIGFVLARNISRPLQRVSNIANLVGDGDLSVRVPMSDRHDEVGALSNAFNQMIDNLRDTTQKNQDQNWLNSNLAEFTQLLQGQRQLETVARIILSKVTPLVEAQQSVFYILDANADPPVLKLLSSYAYQERKHLSNQFHLGEGLVGQCALEKQRILLTQVPNDGVAG